jgi:hypothetical protein
MCYDWSRLSPRVNTYTQTTCLRRPWSWAKSSHLNPHSPQATVVYVVHRTPSPIYDSINFNAYESRTPKSLMQGTELCPSHRSVDLSKHSVVQDLPAEGKR